MYIILLFVKKKKCKKFVFKKYLYFNMLMFDYIDYFIFILIVDYFKKWDDKIFVCCFFGNGLFKFLLVSWYFSD